MASSAHLVILLLHALFLGVAAQSLTINVTQQGDYTISRKDGSVWLRSAPAFFVVNNVTYSAADSTLTLLGINTTKTADYLTYNLYYRANVTGIVASVNVYNTGYIGFTVTFPDGANQTRANSPDDVICGFPGFRVDPAPARLAYLSYGTSTLEAAVGRWENGSMLLYGGRQGSGPFALFDKSNNAVAMGPSSSFTLASLWHDVQRSYVYWGVMGGVTQLPAGFQYGIVVVGSDGQVGSSVAKWAMVVKEKTLQHQPPSQYLVTPPRAVIDPTDLLGSLGYWTSQGSAYYAGPEAGKTYEDTLVDVRKDSANHTLTEPTVDYLYVEVDDWWYVKGQGGSVKTWTAPKSVFPDGIAGMANKTHWIVAAACGVWASDTTYAKQNGGPYDFLMGDACALPKDQTFWDTLFKQAVDNRVRVFVQNNMEQQYLCMTSGDSDVDTVMTWLSQLNVSASQHSMEVLYSGAIPRLVMEAAFRHTVTPAVKVGSGIVTEPSHWKVGVANIFISALDLRPFLGVIQSYRNDSVAPATQLSPMLYNLLATLTGGPVAIGDEIGKSDRMIIERCCNAQGRVMSPVRPARAIDDQLQQMAWGGDVGSTGEIWTAFTSTHLNSDRYANFYSGIIMAAGMTRPHVITPSSTGLVFAPVQGETLYAPTKLFRDNNPYVLYDFADDKPFTLTNCTIEDYCLYYVAPVFKFQGKEVVLMGELTKWVPMSAERVVRVEVGDAITVYTRGVPEEKVYMWFHVDGTLQSLEHRIGADGTGLIEYELGPKSSACHVSASVNFVIVFCASLMALLRMTFR